VDDGSTDNTKEIVQKFNNSGIRYIALESNHGVSHARNVAIQQARGEFIVSLDADDMLTPDFISKHLIELEKHPDADMVYCDDLLIDEDDKPIRTIKRQNYKNRKSLIRDLFRCGFPIVHCRHFVRKNIFDRIGLYDESLIVGEDYDLMRRFVKEDLKLYHLPENLCLRRVVDSSLSRKFSVEKAKSHFDVVKRYADTFSCDELFPDVDWNKIAPEKRKLQAKCLSAITCFTIGQSYANTNAPVYAKTAFDQACSELSECFRMDPANPHVQQLLRKCEAVRTECEQTVQETVY
jgi:glycosyltransferase involved in cell wall biosynthesis